MTLQKRRLRYRDLEDAGYGSRTTIWRAWKAKTFPLPHDDGRGKPIWYLEDIDAWEDESELLYADQMPGTLSVEE